MNDKKYQIIYADPPWQQSRGGKKAVRKNSSGIELPYKVRELCIYWFNVKKEKKKTNLKVKIIFFGFCISLLIFIILFLFRGANKPLWQWSFGELGFAMVLMGELMFMILLIIFLVSPWKKR